MKKLFNYLLMFVLAVIICFVYVSCGQQETSPNTLTKKEIKEGWQLLFDGTTTNGWRGYNQKSFPEYGWTVENGILRCLASGRGEAGSGGDIITEKKFKNFEFKLEWKIAKAGNSGIMYLVTELPGQPAWHGAPEMQILDGKNFPSELKLNQLSGSLYDLVAADPQNVKLFGEWNQIKILVNNGNVEHWQNGEMVASYQLWTSEWEDMVNNSKFKDYPEFLNLASEGHICIQDHGCDVWFKNIKIREL